MTFMHSNKVREMDSGQFDTFTQRFLMIELAHIADKAGIIREGQKEIGDNCLMSARTVAREMVNLVGKRLLEKEKHGQYRVNIFVGKADKTETEKAEVETKTKVDEFEEWWEDNKVEINDMECVITPTDNPDEQALAYEKDDKLELFQGRPLSTKYDGYDKMCYIFTKVE